MEEAFHYVHIMTAEADVPLLEYMRHLALTIHFSKPNREIKLKFIKVWATPPTDRSSDKEAFARTVELSFKKTRMKLLKVLKAAWEDKTMPVGAPRNRGFIIPDHLKSIVKFGRRGRQLIELLLAATIVVDYCLDFTTQPLPENTRTLLEFVRDLFHGETSFMSGWRLLEYLFRAKVWVDKATLTKVKENPFVGKTVLIGAVYLLYPEKVRDWAVTTIHHNRKRKGDLFFTDLVTEKDASAWAFRVVGHLYSKPDRKFAHSDKLPLLYLRSPTKYEIGYEKSRHEKLMGEGEYSEKPADEDEKNEGDNDNESDYKKGKEAEEVSGSEVESSLKLQPVLHFDSDKDDSVVDLDAMDGTAKTTSGNPANPPDEDIISAAGTTASTAAAKTTAGEKDIEEQSRDGNDKKKGNGDDDGKIQSKTHNEEPGKVDDAVNLRIRIDPVIKWKGLASNSDLETRNYVLEYLSVDRVKCTFELGKLDHIHHTHLEQVPHLLSNSSKRLEDSEIRDKKKRGGLLFVPRDESHVIYDYGIFRFDDPIMKKHRDRLRDVDFDLILRFLCKHGFIDRKRDKWKTGGGYAIQPLRVSVGSADHNFEHRHSEKERRNTVWNFLRDLPRNDCGVSLMTTFDVNLPKEIGKLMDFEALLLRDKFESINTPMDGVLQDGFIYSVFTEPFINLFSCTECRFPSFDLTVMDAEDLLPDEIGKYHTDGGNGILSGNDISATLSLFFRSKKILDSLVEDGLSLKEATEKAKLLLRGEPDVERLKRLYMIFFTRRAHEHFRDNEAMAENFKTLLRTFRDKLDRDYKTFGGSFGRPQDISFPDTPQLSLSMEPINGFEWACYKMSPSYAREIYCAGGMTVLYGANVILADYGKARRKMLELYVVALSMGSWFKFYYSGMELLVTMKDHIDDNLIVLLLQGMEAKFGSWNGGPQHRGRATNVDLLLHYKDPANVEAAVTAMEHFLVVLETKPTLELEEFKTELTAMVSSLLGVGEHYGMNLGLYAGLTGLLSANLHNCFLTYPIAGQGSANTLQAQDDILQAELDVLRSKEGISGEVVDRIKEIGLRADLKGYHKTVRLVSSFCGIEQRYCWVENICCDGIGPNQTKFDYAFPGQSMFWFHLVDGRKDDIRRMTFIVHRKQWGSQIWTDVQKFF
jgi:hypothetical protein